MFMPLLPVECLVLRRCFRNAGWMNTQGFVCRHLHSGKEPSIPGHLSLASLFAVVGHSEFQLMPPAVPAEQTQQCSVEFLTDLQRALSPTLRTAASGTAASMESFIHSFIQCMEYLLCSRHHTRSEVPEIIVTCLWPWREQIAKYINT